MKNLRDAIIQFRGQPRKIVTVKVPDIEDPVILQRLKYGEFKDLISGGDVVQHLSLLLVRMIVDNDGRRIFQDEESAELDELPTNCINFLLEEANKLNGITKKDTEASIKNSEASRNGVSASA